MRKLQGSLFFAFLFSGLFLFLALRGIDWQEVSNTARQARLEYLGIGCLIGSVVNFVRSLRWRVLLSAEKWLPMPTVFWATMAGYLGNSFLPARAGELIRSAALGGRCGISSSFVLATALTERIMDAVALVAVGLTAIVLLGNQSDMLLSAALTMAVISTVGMVGVVLSPRLEAPLRRALLRIPLPDALIQRGLGMSQRFLAGVRSLQDPQRASTFAGLTGLIWLMDAFGTTVAAWALNLPLDLFQALLLLAALGLASAIPSTPGYVGTYQFVAVTVLPMFDFTRSQALTFILVLQASNYVVVVVWGLLGLWRLAAENSEHRN